MEDYLMLIDGEWVGSSSGEYIEVQDPATERFFARVPKATEEAVTRALEAAQRAFPAWARLSPDQRGAYLWQASDILEKRKEEVGRVLTQEQGKPLKEAVGEIEKVIEMLRYYAEEGKRAYLLDGGQGPHTDRLSLYLVGAQEMVLELKPGE